MACVEECISERKSRKFEEGLNTKVKSDMYKCFGKGVEFKKYLHGICDVGSKLLFKFRMYTKLMFGTAQAFHCNVKGLSLYCEGVLIKGMSLFM